MNVIRVVVCVVCGCFESHLMRLDGWQVVAARREARRHRRQIGHRANLEHQIHADEDVELEVTVEQPETCVRAFKEHQLYKLLNQALWNVCKPTGIVGSEAHDHITVIGHRNRVLQRRRPELPMQQTPPVQVECVLQVDLLHRRVGRPAHADHVERGAVNVERMAEVGLLHCKRTRNRLNTALSEVITNVMVQHSPSSTSTTSTIAFNGMSTLCVHMQFISQFGGRLSPLQNCSAGMSSICEIIGAGGDTYEISSISEIK